MHISYQYDINKFICARVQSTTIPDCTNQIVFQEAPAVLLLGMLYDPITRQVHAIQKGEDGGALMDAEGRYIKNDQVTPIDISNALFLGV